MSPGKEGEAEEAVWERLPDSTGHKSSTRHGWDPRRGASSVSSALNSSGVEPLDSDVGVHGLRRKTQHRNPNTDAKDIETDHSLNRK